jgi:hypothetical protein
MSGETVERGVIDGNEYTVWQSGSSGKKFVTVFDGGREGRGTHRSMSWLKKWQKNTARRPGCNKPDQPAETPGTATLVPDTEPEVDTMADANVHIDYYKEGGKWYAEADLKLPCRYLGNGFYYGPDGWDRVGQLARAGKAPGLTGDWGGYAVVSVEGGAGRLLMPGDLTKR